MYQGGNDFLNSTGRQKTMDNASSIYLKETNVSSIPNKTFSKLWRNFETTRLLKFTFHVYFFRKYER